MAASKMKINHLKKKLLEAENILDSEFSFEAAEPIYKESLSIIYGIQDMGAVEELIIRMYSEGFLTSQPVSYLMHVLKSQPIKSWLEMRLASQGDIAHGSEDQKILDAYNDGWEDREFYSF